MQVSVQTQLTFFLFRFYLLKSDILAKISVLRKLTDMCENLVVRISTTLSNIKSFVV